MIALHEIYKVRGIQDVIDLQQIQSQYINVRPLQSPPIQLAPYSNNSRNMQNQSEKKFKGITQSMGTDKQSIMTVGRMQQKPRQ
jgi:hypothetical protein